MTLDEVLASLFGEAFKVDERPDGTLLGEGRLNSSDSIALIGIVNRMPLGVEGALALAQRVLSLVRAGSRQAILVLVDSDSQRMSRRDELMGLNEYLAHLAKALLVADRAGFPTITLLYGGGAAGAFIATALATRALIALPGAKPAVMDLPSMSRVTKLPVDLLERMSQSSPVFAPGLVNMQLMGAVTESWSADSSLRDQMQSLLPRIGEIPEDQRDRLGQQRGGRTKASGIAEQVMQQAMKAPMKAQ